MKNNEAQIGYLNLFEKKKIIDKEIRVESKRGGRVLRKMNMKAKVVLALGILFLIFSMTTVLAMNARTVRRTEALHRGMQGF